MRNVRLSVLATVASCATGLALTATPAHAADPWFGPRLDSAIDNSAGPGPAPRGAATGDFNADGVPDLASIGDFTLGDIRVSLGNGDGTFASATTIGGTSQTQGMDVGDVTGDGHADVVAMTTTSVRVLAGNGDGTFTQIGTHPLMLGAQVHPLLVDLDGDGDLDVVAPTFTAISTLLNNGSGDFSSGPSSNVLGASTLSAIAIARLNADAVPDLFAVDGFSGTTFALTGTGTGAFTRTGSLYASGFIPEDVAAIDLNGDGFDDAATIGSFSFTLATGLTNGSGAFRSLLPARVAFGGPGPTSVSVADLDEDGRQDLVVSSLANPLQGTLTVLAGNGTAGMARVGTFATAPFPQNPVLADWDGDGDVDVVTVSPGTVSFLPNTTP